MRSSLWAVWAACLVVAAALAVATALRPLVSPPTLEQRVMAIAADVRCPECQGESAAESNAAASQAIRAEIARDLQAGDSRSAILRQIAGEYGEWILYRPPARGAFILLWATPLLALVAVGGVLWRLFLARRGRPNPTEAAPAAPPAPAPEQAEDVRRRLSEFL